jgi:Flp pilus assembly protein TadB
LKSRTKLLLALPVIAVLVIILVYFQLFTNPLVIATIFILWVVVSLWNRRKFARQRKEAEASPKKAKPVKLTRSPSLSSRHPWRRA